MFQGEKLYKERREFDDHVVISLEIERFSLGRDGVKCLCAASETPECFCYFQEMAT